MRVAEKIVCVRDGGKWVECGEGGKYSTVEGLGGLVGRLYDEQEASEEMEAGRMEL